MNPTAIDRPVHGGARPDQLRANIIDFSASINPYAPPPGLRRVLAAADVKNYPDPAAGRLTALLASAHNLRPEGVLVGNGAAELVFLIARALLRPGSRVVVVGPAFGEYAYASALAGAEVTTYLAPEAAGFRPELGELTRLLSRTRPDLVWAANPANPTGVYLPAGPFKAILEASNGILVLDEAFRSFVAKPWPSEALLGTGRVILLRSLTKDFGLAGLRLGLSTARKTMDKHGQIHMKLSQGISYKTDWRWVRQWIAAPGLYGNLGRWTARGVANSS